jgi:cytochrome P450
MTSPFDFGDPAFISNPYSAYKLLQAQSPVYRSSSGAWIVTGYQEVAALLRDARMAKDFSGLAEILVKRGESEPAGSPLASEFSRWMLFRDPPEHSRLRGLVVKAFTPRMIASKRAAIEELADSLLDRVAPQGTMEAIGDFAYLLPFTVIAGILGLPSEDQPQLRDWTTAVARAMDPVKPDEVLAKANEAVLHLRAYVSAQVADRRANPRDDLLSSLLAAESDGLRLSEDELISNVLLLFGAGHETTMNQIGNALLALLQHPDQMALLQDRPELIPTAVEELLRYDSAVQFVHRWARESIDVGDVHIESGSEVLLFIAAANRDSSRFSKPDVLDVTRTQNRHLALGGGAHFCLGSSLARLEIEVALKAVINRFPDVALMAERLPVYKDNLLLRGLKRLELSLGGDSAAVCPFSAGKSPDPDPVATPKPEALEGTCRRSAVL